MFQRLLLRWNRTSRGQVDLKSAVIRQNGQVAVMARTKVTVHSGHYLPVGQPRAWLRVEERKTIHSLRTKVVLKEILYTLFLFFSPFFYFFPKQLLFILKQLNSIASRITCIQSKKEYYENGVFLQPNSFLHFYNFCLVFKHHETFPKASLVSNLCGKHKSTLIVEYGFC